MSEGFAYPRPRRNEFSPSVRRRMSQSVYFACHAPDRGVTLSKPPWEVEEEERSDERED